MPSKLRMGMLSRPFAQSFRCPGIDRASGLSYALDPATRLGTLAAEQKLIPFGSICPKELDEGPWSTTHSPAVRGRSGLSPCDLAFSHKSFLTCSRMDSFFLDVGQARQCWYHRPTYRRSRSRDRVALLQHNPVIIAQACRGCWSYVGEVVEDCPTITDLRSLTAFADFAGAIKSKELAPRVHRFDDAIRDESHHGFRRDANNCFTVLNLAHDSEREVCLDIATYTGALTW